MEALDRLMSNYENEEPDPVAEAHRVPPHLIRTPPRFAERSVSRSRSG